MQEIKAKSLLSRQSAWNKLLGRCRYCRPPFRKSAIVREGSPMTISKLLLVLFIFVSACGYSNALATKERSDKVTGTCNRNTYTIAQSALEHNAEYVAIFPIHRTAAGPRPSSFVDDQLPTSFLIGSTPVGRYVTSGRQRFYRAQGKSSERDRSPINGTAIFNEKWFNAFRDSYGLAHRQIQASISQLPNRNQ